MYDDIMQRFYADELSSLRLARFRAVLNAMTEAEICDFAIGATDGRLELKERHKLNNIIVNDVKKSWKECHTSLLEFLVIDSSNVPFWRRQRYAILLEQLLSSKNVPAVEQRKAIRHLLSSKYSSERSRAYAVLDEDAVSGCEDLIISNWVTHGDYGAAACSIDLLSTDKLDEIYDALLASIISEEDDYNYQVLERRLYRRATMTLERMSALKRRNGITYAYTCFYRDVKMSDPEAEELWEKYKDSEKAGILLWVFGRLKLWHVLVGIELPDDPLNY